MQLPEMPVIWVAMRAGVMSSPAKEACHAMYQCIKAMAELSVQKLRLSQAQKQQIATWQKTVCGHMQDVQKDRHGILSQVVAQSGHPCCRSQSQHSPQPESLPFSNAVRELNSFQLMPYTASTYFHY